MEPVKEPRWEVGMTAWVHVLYGLWIQVELASFDEGRDIWHFVPGRILTYARTRALRRERPA